MLIHRAEIDTSINVDEILNLCRDLMVFVNIMYCSWALVKDGEIAKKMTKFIEISTIGVSKDSQIRAANILDVLSGSIDHVDLEESETFFDYSYELMTKRWRKLTEAVNRTKLFSLPEFSLKKCSFSERTFGQLPGNGMYNFFMILFMFSSLTGQI